jgi:hypothetical protein
MRNAARDWNIDSCSLIVVYISFYGFFPTRARGSLALVFAVAAQLSAALRAILGSDHRRAHTDAHSSKPTCRRRHHERDAERSATRPSVPDADPKWWARGDAAASSAF